MFQAGLLLIRRIDSVQTAVGIDMRCADWLLPANTKHGYTSCCLYRVDPSLDEQQDCSKHVEAY